MPFQLNIRHNIDSTDDHFAAGSVREFDTDTVRIGSGPECECRIDEPEFAERHLTIEVPASGRAVAVAHADAFVGEEPLADRAELWSGDELRVGHWTLRFQRVYGSTGQARSVTVLSGAAKVLVAAILGAEVLVVFWLPRQFQGNALWQQEVARQRTLRLLDSLRWRSSQCAEAEDPFAKSAHAAVTQQLDERARYLRTHAQTMSAAQQRRIFGELDAYAAIITQLEAREGLHELPEIDIDAGVRALMDEADRSTVE